MGQEKELFESVRNEERGTPQNEHMKKKALEKEARKKEWADQKKFYTVKRGKVLLVTVKANGSYQSYVGKADNLKEFILKQKAANTHPSNTEKTLYWVDEYEADAVAAQYLEEIAANQAKGKKAK